MYQGNGGFFASAMNVGQRRQNNGGGKQKKPGNFNMNQPLMNNPNFMPKQQKKKQKQKLKKQLQNQVKGQQMQPIMMPGTQLNLAAAAQNFMAQKLLNYVTQPTTTTTSNPPANTKPEVKISTPTIKPSTPDVKISIANVKQSTPEVKAAPEVKPIPSEIKECQSNVVLTPAVTQATPMIVPNPESNSSESEISPKTEAVDVTVSDTTSETGSRGKPKWKKAKFPRAQRMKAANQNLRRILQPKNAVVVLNEMLADSSNLSMSFTASPECSKATVSVGKDVFEGVGNTKVAARNAAAEAALKHIILKKLAKVFEKKPPAEAAATDVTMTEIETVEKKEEDDGEISLGHVASYAMFKLFDTWSNDDAASPGEKTAALELVATPVPDKMVGAKKLPDNPTELHPSMLLHQMNPNVVYELVCVTGSPPKLCFTMKCIVNDKFYIGNGPNKKSAKKDAAITACKDLFNVVYENP